MMKNQPIQTITFTFKNRAEFQCEEIERGVWVCVGEVTRLSDPVEYRLKFNNAAATYVFQHLDDLVKGHFGGKQ